MLNFLLGLFRCQHDLGWPWLAASGETYRTCSACLRKLEVDAETWQPLSRKTKAFAPRSVQKPAIVAGKLLAVILLAASLTAADTIQTVPAPANPAVGSGQAGQNRPDTADQPQPGVTVPQPVEPPVTQPDTLPAPPCINWRGSDCMKRLLLKA